MSDPTPAQEEFSRLVNSNSSDSYRVHPEDRDEERFNRTEVVSEEDEYRNSQIDAAMRIPAFDRLNGGGATAEIKLPPASFDSGRSTGVKGVIADARSYETAKKQRFMSAVRTARRSIFGLDSTPNTQHKYTSGESDSDGEASGSDEESFLQQWRESRRRELESEANHAPRTRRTSPSVRIYGRFDEVDALGYLDAIEKVGRDTIVVVFVYDHECPVSSEIESALIPLVSKYTAIHFVKVHYEEIEFDNAGVPAVLAYRNQGDLFANLTGIIEMIPDEESFGTGSLQSLFRKHNIL